MRIFLRFLSLKKASDPLGRDSVSKMSLATISLIGLLIYLIYHFYVYPALISPLSKIPNAHWSVPITSLWILRQRYEKRENYALEKAHKRFGPFVRTGPNEVSVDGLEGIRTVYQGGFEKADWYEIFDNYGYVHDTLNLPWEEFEG